ncbi:MAG: YceI family protein [Bacteroidales bacterium]|nr:MAG: YceI family protein [Bacteroidales bacterium]
MNKSSINRLIIIVLVIILSNHSIAQRTFEVIREKSSISVSGTSTLHNWEMPLQDYRCNLLIDIYNPSITIKKVDFKGISKSLKSDYSVMDKKTYKALKADTYKEIQFASSYPEEIPLGSKSFKGEIAGSLFIGGVTKSITLFYTGKIISDELIRVTGSKKLAMTEFNIDPPTAMLGTLKTGDEVVIKFNLILKQLK